MGGSGDVRGRVVRGTFFHAPRADGFACLADTLLVIDDEGRIADVLRPGSSEHAALASDDSGRVMSLPSGNVMLPGFVDCHVHAPQFPQLGLALDVPLETWLMRYTFPLEARYADLDFAARAYGQLVDDLLAGGTTTALYFATVHVPATRLLADLCITKGQRALIGKVAMDLDTCPDFYRDADAADAVAGTRAIIGYIRAHPGNDEGRVLPVVTPRFIPACTDEALEGLGRLAAETGAHVQTHCSESDWAHGYVRDRHGMSDAESLDRFGLLGRRSIVAHANFLSDGDMDLLVQRGAGVAHCAHSNAYFANAVFPLRRALEKGLHVGLGTDISGGPSASMLDAQRMTVAASRMLEDGVDARLPAGERGRKDSRVDMVTAFHLATAGGAEALDLPVGSFEIGRKFDAIIIDTEAAEGTIRLFDRTEPADVLAGVLYQASRANIAYVWVDGRLVRSHRDAAPL
ncbi:MAG: guanine deaminase [Devosia sp.]